MKLVAPAVVLLLGVSLATACGSGAHQQKASAGAGTIVFESTTGCDEIVNGIRPDGTGLSQLLRAPSCAGVYFNEAGTKAVVLRPNGVGSGPYILDLRSGKKLRVPVTGLAESIEPIDHPWSPNGKRLLLAIGSEDADRDTYIVYNPRTTDWVEVDASTEDVAVWSANGKSVLFPTAHGIDAASVNAGSKRLVSFPRQWHISTVKPSADGKWISFLKEDPKGQSLYVVRPDGRGLRRIADEVSTAAWSPAGERLAYENDDGVGVAVPTSGRTTLVDRAPAVDPYGQSVALWSPDGKWILYSPSDLGFGAPAYGHQRLWAVQADGRGAHPVTNAFMGGTSIDATPVAWVSSDLHGTPAERPALVEPQGRPVLTTKLPIVALGVLGDGVAVGTGFGRKPSEGVKLVRAPRGPIVRRAPAGRVTEFQPPDPCPTVSSLALTSSDLAYVCDTSRYEQGRYALRIGRKVVFRAVGGQGFGSFIGGPATDGRTIAYSVTDIPIPQPPKYTFLPGSTRIYAKRGSPTTLVRTLPGYATLESISDGRIALLKFDRHQTVIVLTRHGGTKSFRFPTTEYLSSVVLAGDRLFVVQDGRLVSVDIASGRRRSLRIAVAGDTTAPQLAGIRGDLAAYVLGATIHVMRLSDGREVVLDTPGATTPTLASFGAGGLFYVYNEAYSKQPGRVGFITLNTLEHVISAKGRQAR